MSMLICQLLLLIFGESLFVRRSKGYELLSQNRTAHLSRQYNEDSPAYKAVDGDLRQKWPHVAATKNSTSVYWYVDLGAPRNIHSVVIYYRQEPNDHDVYRKRFAGFSLYISDDTNFTSGYDCGVNSTYPPSEYNISCQYTGQYVALYNNRSDGQAFLELAEVQVFGCLNSAEYGTSCDNACSSTCQNGRCSILNGSCFSCATGYVLINGSCVCRKNKYGPACEFDCGKCKNEMSCNSSTGECATGCAQGLDPPMCNKGILSRGKHTSMSPPFESRTTAEKAVDGFLNQRFPNMAVTEISTFVYWYVDLGTAANIKSVNIYYRNETEKQVETYRKRFDGFSLYISDDNNTETGYRCPVNSAYPPLIYNISCQYGGRYVKLYNKRSDKSAILEFGEVQVFGCLTSMMYGVGCENRCPSNCKDRRCNVVDGKCFHCVAGYKGDRCDNECGTGKYGDGCALTCSNKCAGGKCNTYDGNCSYGCVANYYGVTCDKNCPDFCKNGTCNQILGHCENGCKSGYFGLTFCNNECNGKCKNNETCNQVNGKCDNGCKHGYYGYNCSNTCSGNCKNNVNCQQETGNCSHGCATGYYSPPCNVRCSGHCKDNITCNSTTGFCDNGCAAGYKDNKCDRVCENNTYGLDCKLKCGKCRTGQSCNHRTGDCTNGCAEGFYPPMCKMRILSQGKNTFMSPRHGSATRADKAVDGNLNQKYPNMAVTKMSTSVYWYVDLGVPANINNVKIYYRNESETEVKTYRKRFSGFSLYISDDRKKGTGHKCPVNSIYPPLIYNIKCQFSGRYVKLFNYRSNRTAILELGEVQVVDPMQNVGCESSTQYGNNCEHTCSQKCKDQRCNIVDGKCLSCPAGYKGDLCDNECQKGKYGKGCTLTCSEKCAGGAICNRHNGSCPNGCVPYFYRRKCNRRCPGFCKNGTCNQISGRCEKGCKRNYYSAPFCNKTCSGNCFNDNPCNESNGACDKGCKLWYYGSNCTKVCNGSCKNRENCDQMTGNCKNGCAPGYFGKQCNQKCPSNYCLNGECNQDTGHCDNCKYGYFRLPNCSNQCSNNCKSNTACNQIDGKCEKGCTHGYHGLNCSNTCPSNCKNHNCQQGTGNCIDGCASGYYSPLCNLRCSGNCMNNVTCNYTSGVCENGCAAGYKGIMCDKECDLYEHGHDCKHQCGKCKDKKTCNKISGKCDNGCDRGYQEPFCNTTCEDGFYGYSCNETCTEHCKNGTICNVTSGNCDVGCDVGYQGYKCDKVCDEGWYGDRCENVCSANCENGAACHHVTGVCKFGCKDGFYDKKCQSNCSENCFDGQFCNKKTGICDNGCASGWESSKCDKECPKMKYGTDCQSKCGVCRNGKTCNRFNGTCENGCDPGYFTKLCNRECLAGHYGQNCSLNCSGNCVNNPCKPQDGACDQKGCIAGWKGRLCDIRCPFGFFGDDCSSECSGNCLNNDTCHHTNGSCLQGCASHWDGELCLLRVEPFTEPEPSPGIAVGIIAAIILIMITIVVVMYMRRRRKQPDRPLSAIDDECLNTPLTEHRPNTSADNEGAHGNLYVNSAEVSRVDGHSQNDQTYYNMTDNLIRRNEDVKIEELCNVIKSKSKNGNTLFSREFKELPQGEQHPCVFAKKQENVPKNRFKTTFPYDHSRIILQITPKCNSDYVNANYIENVDGDRIYIAAQGPKQNTLTDFWRMVWQERVVKIVMLTNLVEGIKKKCDKYWPGSGEVMRKGDFVIQLQEEKFYASYNIRTFMVTNKAARQDRIVVHFHFTQWPDHGVPDSLALVVFHRHVIRTPTIETGKYTVVHCSAGIGRTGTYIAVDALYKYGEKTGFVNVPNYVRTMRKDRMSMIQNEDQYKTIYNALYEAFRGQSRVIPKEEFVYEFEKQTNPSTPVNANYLRTSFNELNLLTSSYTKSDFVSGQENIHANFTKKVLPVERFRCNLYSYVKGRGNYYNAVYLQSYSMNDGLVSAQFPLPDYTEDFLRLVDDVEADTVVFINPLSQIQSTNVWLPVQGKPRNVGAYTVSMDSPPACTNNVKQTSLVLMKEINVWLPVQGKPRNVETISVSIDSPPVCTNNVKRTSLVLKKVESDGHNIDVFEPVSWNIMKSLPSDPRIVLDLVTQVQEAQTSKINKRIIVLSADGAGGCGLFCSVFNALQQLSLDSEVDIFNIVRQLKIRRPEMILNTEEYQFCFKTVAAHLKDDAIYANC